MRHKKSMIELPLFNSLLCFYSPSIFSFALTAAPRFLRDTYNFKNRFKQFHSQCSFSEAGRRRRAKEDSCRGRKGTEKETEKIEIIQ